MWDLILVGAGGFVGANARFFLSNLFARCFGTAFPYGTFIINLSGSFILGFFLGLVSRSFLEDPAYRLLIATGFCGGYTTFSTYSYETLTLLREGGFNRAIFAYLLGSCGLGLLSAWLGFWSGSLFLAGG